MSFKSKVFVLKKKNFFWQFLLLNILEALKFKYLRFMHVVSPFKHYRVQLQMSLL